MLLVIGINTKILIHGLAVGMLCSKEWDLDTGLGSKDMTGCKDLSLRHRAVSETLYSLRHV